MEAAIDAVQDGPGGREASDSWRRRWVPNEGAADVFGADSKAKGSKRGARGPLGARRRTTAGSHVLGR